MKISFEKTYVETLTRNVPAYNVAYCLQKEYLNRLACKEFGVPHEEYTAYRGKVYCEYGKLYLISYLDPISKIHDYHDPDRVRELTQKEIVIINSLDLLREEFKDD